MLREILDEFAALGWHAIAHGPEIHLAWPWALFAVGVLTLFWRGRK